MASVGVKKEIVDKITSFSIGQAIESMEDFGWCPINQCQAPAEIEKVKNYGKCTQCLF